MGRQNRYVLPLFENQMLSSENIASTHAEHAGSWQRVTGDRSCRFGVSLSKAFLGFGNTRCVETGREVPFLPSPGPGAPERETAAFSPNALLPIRIWFKLQL